MEEPRLQIALENWQKLQPLSEEDRPRRDIQRQVVRNMNCSSKIILMNFVIFAK